MSAIADLRSSRDLLLNLTQRDIKGKYKRTALGQLWSLVNPIALMITYSVVFAFILRNKPLPGNPSGIDYFFLWLSCGLLPWIFFSNVLMQGMGSIVGNANLVLKVYFPRETLVLSSSLALLFTFCFEMSVLVVATLVFGSHPKTINIPAVVPTPGYAGKPAYVEHVHPHFLGPIWFLPGTIFLMVLIFLLGTGVAFFLAVANVYFRDTQHFVAIILNLGFYLAPIVYPPSLLDPHRHAHPILVGLVEWNPITKFAEAFRNCIYDGRWPALETVLYLTAISVVIFLAGYVFFRHHTARMAEEL
jgi:ABC-type polysaccharide/polyol phosphate export permease